MTTKPRQARDCAGNTISVGDKVSPITATGDHRDAPVYTVTKICTDDCTVQLMRSDGSTLWHKADELLSLHASTQAAKQDRSELWGEDGGQLGSGPLFAPASLVEVIGQGTSALTWGSVERWQLSDPRDGGPCTMRHTLLIDSSTLPEMTLKLGEAQRLPHLPVGTRLILRGAARDGRHIALAGEVTYWRANDAFAVMTLTSTIPTASPDPEFYFAK